MAAFIVITALIILIAAIFILTSNYIKHNRENPDLYVTEEDPITEAPALLTQTGIGPRPRTPDGTVAYYTRPNASTDIVLLASFALEDGRTLTFAVPDEELEEIKPGQKGLLYTRGANYISFQPYAG